MMMVNILAKNVIQAWSLNHIHIGVIGFIVPVMLLRSVFQSPH